MAKLNVSKTASFIWSVADLLRSDFRPSQYGRVVLPFTVLRRLECLLEESKDKVIAEHQNILKLDLSEESIEIRLLKVTNNLSFYNTYPANLANVEPRDVRNYLIHYVQCFSKEVREIFEHFNFDEIVDLLDNANLLYPIVNKFTATDLSPKMISNSEMGLVFEALVNKCSASSNETAGEYFTPPDVVNLIVSLVLGDTYRELNHQCSIYDPAAGTGRFLESGIEYLRTVNPQIDIQAFGQELDSEAYAICKSSMLMNGYDSKGLKLGNTLSRDQHSTRKFDFMFCHSPFGFDWKKIEQEIKDENALKGFDGRFGPGLPRVSDGSLLFLMHLISKMRDTHNADGSVSDGSRIGIILHGAPLFTGEAGSGESEIRRFILESDLLEAIVALPTDMFYNTGIATYVWILSNKKSEERKGKVQLINAMNLGSKMRKSLGSKRNYLTDDDINTINKTYIDFIEKADTEYDENYVSNKILGIEKFGYLRFTIERPLRLSVKVIDESIASLRFAPKPFNDVMQAVYEQFGCEWTDETYGSLTEVEAEVRTMIKAEFPELKETQIKDVLDSKIWSKQKSLMEDAKKLQLQIGTEQFDDFNLFDLKLKKALKATDVKFDAKQKKQFIDAVSWKNQDAEPVIKKALKEEEQPLYGAFAYNGDLKQWQGKVVEFQSDSDFRDNENIFLDKDKTNSLLIEQYFKKEIEPNLKDAWVNASKSDEKDRDIGVVGYRINFGSYFFKKYVRDNLLQGKLIRFKDIVITSPEGNYSLDPLTGKIVEFHSYSEKRRSFNLPRFDFISEKILPEFYNIFLRQEEGQDWLDSNFMSSSSWKHVSFSNWLNTRISLPSVANQAKLVEFWSECDSVLNRIELLKKSAFSDFHTALEQILPYQSAQSRYEGEFSSLLPTPLAILWELAESKFNEKDRCEAFTKYFEYLGYYLVSLIYGNTHPINKNDFFQKKRGELVFKNITMAFGYNRLKDAKKTASIKDDILSTLARDEIIDFLKKATELRNHIAHRGLPSAASVKDAKEKVQTLKDFMQLELRYFFEHTSLIKPIQARFDGRVFSNEVDVCKGLGLNPSRTTLIKTKEPLISNQLYLAHEDLDSEGDLTVTKVFPLMIARETVPDSEIIGFYFCSDDYDGQLRYVCPYPNVETNKLEPIELITRYFND